MSGPLDLFPEEGGKKRGRAGAHAPLADRMRPQTLEEFEGSEKLLAMARAASEPSVAPHAAGVGGE